MNTASDLIINVINAFDTLTESLAKLTECIHSDENLIAWVENQSAKTRTRLKICEIFQQISYHNTQAPREILICAGFLGASTKTIECAKIVNHDKDHFKSTILELRKAKLTIDQSWFHKNLNSPQRDSRTHSTLSQLGLARLHLKQCYRKIPILDSAPSKISWTWAHTKSIKKITAKEAYNMLIKKTADEGITFQLAKLAKLPESEPLAIIQELAPHLRANLVFKNESNDTSRKMIKGPIPIIFPATTCTHYPKFAPPSPKCDKDKERAVRNDVKIEPTPFLPAIRAHRYLSVKTPA